jgi:RNA polymerase sigma-70 factor, ECF subfamily
MTERGERDRLAERFQEQRPYLKTVAYRMLGSTAEAEDAVQEAWLRLARTPGLQQIIDLRAWLTTVVSRICLNMLRQRAGRREETLDGQVHVPDPLVSRTDSMDPEHELVLADAVGLALQVVLDTLAPAERLAFVLHDLFGLPFDQVAAVVERSPEAARQLASRARRRVRSGAPLPDADLSVQWQVVDAFLAAARDGDFDALLAVLDPDVLLRADGGAVLAATREVRGAHAVASQARVWSHADLDLRRVLVNGAAGAIVFLQGRLYAVVGITVRGGRIVEVDFLADPDRLRRLDLMRLGL